MTDPITALGVAGNALQLAEYMGKLIVRTHAIYRSASEGTDDNAVLENIASRLQYLSSNVRTESI